MILPSKRESRSMAKAIPSCATAEELWEEMRAVLAPVISKLVAEKIYRCYGPGPYTFRGKLNRRARKGRKMVARLMTGGEA